MTRTSTHGAGDLALAVLSQPTADDRATEFKAVDSQAGERYSGSTLVIVAYASIWVIVMVWIASLWKKQLGLAARLEGLERAIDRAADAQEKQAAKPAKKAEAASEAKA